MKTIRTIVTWSMCVVLLVGAAFVANGDVLCIDHDGNTEIESLGVLCCKDSDDCCEGEESRSQSHDHGDCSNCSDVEFDALFGSSLTPHVNNGSMSDVPPSRFMDLDIAPTLLVNSSSPPTTFRRSGPQRAPSEVIAFTVLRC